MSHRAFIRTNLSELGGRISQTAPGTRPFYPSEGPAHDQTVYLVLEKPVGPETACSLAEMTCYLTALVGTLKVLHSVRKE